MTKEAEDPVSNSAQALTMPSGVSTMTWHVINKKLELTDTCIVVDSLVVVVVAGAIGLAAASSLSW